MALTKTPVPINFASGVQTKVDPKQLPIGKFANLKNSVFDVEGQLTKRNGFDLETTLPNTEQTTLTTLNDNLLATGSSLYAYSPEINQWLNRGVIQPIDLEVQPLLRSSSNQFAQDSAVASNGLICMSYVDTNASACFYQISDVTTGQQIVSRTAMPATTSFPRVFVLGRYFIITFMATVSAAPHLQYIAIPISNPSAPRAAVDISTAVSAITDGYDGIIANDTLYIAWSGSGSTVKLTRMSSTLVIATAVSIASHTSTLMSVTADTSETLSPTPIIWVTFWETGTQDGFTAAYSYNLGVILAATEVITNTVINEITSYATGGINTVLYENSNNYNSTGAYPTGGVRTDFISTFAINTSGAVVSPGGTTVMLRSVGLASKPFIAPSGTAYVIITYGESNQPTYFLATTTGSIYMRLAYSNGGGYTVGHVLPTVSELDGTYYVPYRIKTFLASVNKGTALPSGTPTNGIFTQTGINLAIFDINTSGQYSSEIAGALHLTGGQLWEYDGVKPVEHGFHVWPENVASATSTGAGGLVAQTYYYAFCYEWTDNQGNLHRSAPSIPKVQITTTASSTNTLYVPTLRLTDKISPNPVRIVGYRWSTAQPVYYQFTSISSPTLNVTTSDYVTITDAAADSAVLGQTLLYTTGGVIENIAAPASVHSALFKNRLFLIDAEDPNLLWYSKPVIEAVPVELSDLLTIYVAPTAASPGSTGPMRCLAAMDDKLIIFKDTTPYYLTGNGPDITGANNDYGDPVAINSPVGCSNPNSIVLTPNGLMFQSQKGIWQLGRDLSLAYVGAPVEAFNSQVVKSAVRIPNSTQVRFVLDNGLTLLYDYYYDQWGIFTNIRAISSTIYQSQHTYLNEFGQILKETPNTYVDAGNPVLMSLTTGWINLAGLQGFERFYFMHLLGTYITPFKLNVKIAYNYNPSPVQSIIVTPDNFSPAYGDEAVYGGGGNYGGEGNVFSARIFPEQQKCESFQITVEEMYDPSYDTLPGQGLSLSGMNLTIGVKKGSRTQKASQSFG